MTSDRTNAGDLRFDEVKVVFKAWKFAEMKLALEYHFNELSLRRLADKIL